MKPEASIPPDVQAWLDTLPAEDRAALTEVWRLTGTLPAAPDPSPERRAATWAALDALSAPQPVAPRRAASRPPARRMRPLRLWRPRPLVPLAVAAALALLIAVAVLLRLQPTTLHADPGQTLAVDLPDGTHVVLNSGATLAYGPAFDTGQRRVRLTGEAFFTVTPDAARPFRVEVSDARVEVVGTRFNVRSWPGSGLTRVAVASGRVRFSAPDGPAVLLEAGQGSTLRDGRPTAPAPLELNTVMAWRDGGLAFQNEPLGALFDELERRFAVHIEAPAALRARPFSYFRQHVPDAESVLRDLAQMQACAYRATDDGFAVYQP